MRGMKAQERSSDGDAPDAPARGILLAVVLSSVFWVGLALVAYRLL